MSKFAAETGTKRSVLAAQLSGTRRIRLRHVMQYLPVLDHRERQGLLAAWLRDYMNLEMVRELLNPTGDDLSPGVKEWLPALDEDDKQMLAWLAREMARDADVKELFKLLGARVGYHPERPAAGPVKRRRRGGSGALVAFLIFMLLLRGLLPASFAHARQGRAAAVALGVGQCFLLAAAEAA